MKGLGQLHHFLGVTIESHPSGLLLHQRQYALNILERVGMTDCKSCSTPVDTQAKLSADEASPHKRRLKCDTKHQSQEAETTFITSDGSKPYKPWRTLDTDNDNN